MSNIQQCNTPLSLTNKWLDEVLYLKQKYPKLCHMNNSSKHYVSAKLMTARVCL